jgi:hypothetical protein
VVTVSDPDTDLSSVTASVRWKRTSDTTYLDTAPLGALTLTSSPAANGLRTWTLAGRATVEPGSYTIRLTASDGALSTGTEVQVEVIKEAASLQYTGDLLTLTGAGGTGTLTLAATATEESDGALGSELAAATVRFDLFASTDLTMGTPLTGCTSGVVIGTAGMGTAACTVLSLVADTYTVRVSLRSTRYLATDEVVAATVSSATPGSATGGGWLTDPTSSTRSNFGFTVKSTGSKLSGNSLYVYRSTIAERTVKDSLGAYLPAGSYTWVVKSNAMKAYSQQCTLQRVCGATFSGKATIKAVNRGTGKTYSLGGGFGFDVQVTDNGEPGVRAPADTYTIRVSDGARTVHTVGSSGAGITIGGGNIQVRQPK